MCGIFGIFGRSSVSEKVRTGLARLDYRGYDSWGIVTWQGGDLHLQKAVGPIPKTINQSKLLGEVGLGHTRWATHGGVTQKNAHPHMASNGSFALVHNGIVENADQLRRQFAKKGRKFISQTDTEVIVAQVESKLAKTDNWLRAVAGAAKAIDGRNTFALLTKEGEIWASKYGSPLVLGRGKGLLVISSDVMSFPAQINEFCVLDNGQVVRMSGDEVEVYGKSGKKVSLKWEKLNLDRQAGELREAHYMVQEIKETPLALRNLAETAAAADWQKFAALVKQAKRVYVVGSGSSGVAAAQIANYLRQIAGVAADSLVGAECGSFASFFDKNCLIITPSQSGETADVLEMLELAKSQGAKIVSYVNMPGSSMARLSDLSFQANAGPERCVMSTKFFSCQLAWGYLAASQVAGKLEQAQKQLRQAAVLLDQQLADENFHQQIEVLATYLLKKDDIFLLGTGDLMTVAQEGMIKLIEGTYKHAHSIPAGDLKHYAITLIESGVPVLVLTSDSSKDQQLITNAAHEVQARGADVITIGPSQVEGVRLHLSVVNLGDLQAVASVVGLQLLSYNLTVKLGLPVDKPRNIAKSVTVK